mgnify:CR=1 FL=1
MAIDEQKFKQLKKQADDARAAQDRAAGQLEATMERLKNEFDCATIEEAEKLLVKLNKEAAEAGAEYDEAVVTFEKEWGSCAED